MIELTTEDYENIWLRIKDRYLWCYYITATLLAAVFAVIGASVGYALSGNLIEPRIDRYVASEQFGDRVAERILKHLPAIEGRVAAVRTEADALHERIDADLQVFRDALAAIKGQPFVVEPGRITLLGAAGDRITIQYGEDSTGSVTFPHPFAGPPVVTVSRIGFEPKEPFAISRITRKGFSVWPLDVSARRIAWVAIGKQVESDSPSAAEP